MPYTPPIELTESLFSKDVYDAICSYVRDKIDHLDKRLLSFRTETLPEYIRLYKGRPKNLDVDWPWEGAANLQVQLCATFVDELLSRVMGGTYMYDPLWTAILDGDNPDKEGEEIKEQYQTFLQDMAYDPAELDLYRVEQGFYNSGIKYGTGVVHFPWEFQKEVEYVYVSGGEAPDSMPSGTELEFVKRDCPHPEMIPLNRWGFDPDSVNLANMKFFYHIEKLDYWDVKNLRGRSPYYKQSDVDYILESGPDATQEDEIERELNEPKKIEAGGMAAGDARWYIHRVVCKYQHNDKTYCLFINYHKKSRRILFITFNNYPKNLIPYEDVKLAYDEESYLGTGFVEMLHTYQKDLSTNMNWRTNNRNMAMLGLLRFSPESKLASILEIYPGVGIPAKKDEVEYFKAGADIGYNNGPDEFTMALAKERAGVDPATGGTGGGIINPKRGIYSAAGTSMVLGQQNNRNALRTSDMRSAHVKIGGKVGILYANFGIGDKLKRYASNSEKLKAALEAVRNGKLGLRLRPTSAALNKELDRQNDVMLTDRMTRFYQEQAQTIEAFLNPQCPPPMKQYFAQMLVAGRVAMQALLRNFNKSNVDAYLPQVKDLIASAMQPSASPGAGAPNAGNSQVGGLNSLPRLPGGAMGGGALPASINAPQQSL